MKNKMNAEQRREIICQVIEKEGHVSISKLAELSNVTMQTIRRDLDELDKSNRINKAHGKATKYQLLFEPTFSARLQINLKEKQQIGKIAAAQIRENITIICDSTTTVYCFLQLLKNKQNLNIFLNSFVGSQVIQDNLLAGVVTGELHFLGGQLDISEGMTYGEILEQQLRQFFFDKAIVGAGGVSLDYGLSAFSSQVGHVTNMMMSQANEVILLVDHTKIDKRTLYTFERLENVSTIISTIDPPSQNWYRYLQSHSIEWINACVSGP